MMESPPILPLLVGGFVVLVSLMHQRVLNGSKADAFLRYYHLCWPLVVPVMLLLLRQQVQMKLQQLRHASNACFSAARGYTMVQKFVQIHLPKKYRNDR